jgi:Kazal-type serine protease inhibitor domain
VPEALCVCENESPVCGSDGRTYSSMCKLRQEANLRNVDLSVAEWGPCESGISIKRTVNDHMVLIYCVLFWIKLRLLLLGLKM